MKVSNEACKIGCAATIYHLWLQRNKRIHNGNNNIEGIFEPLDMMLGGGLVFVKKRKINCVCFWFQSRLFFGGGGGGGVTSTKVGNQHARLIDSVLGLYLNNLLTNII